MKSFQLLNFTLRFYFHKLDEENALFKQQKKWKHVLIQIVPGKRIHLRK